MSNAATFAGFSPQLFTFLAELEQNNHKPWFDQHRSEYESLYIEPAKEFVAAMGPHLKRISADVHAEPRVNGSIMRINRDVRFSKDKSPYRASLQIMFPQGPEFDRHSPSFLFRLTADALELGADLCGFDKNHLDRYRSATADPKTGKELRAALDKVERNGVGNAPEPHYKRMPKGFDSDHPNADLLLHNAMHVGRAEKMPEELLGDKAVAYCIARYKQAKPLQQWLVENVAA